MCLIIYHTNEILTVVVVGQAAPDMTPSDLHLLIFTLQCNLLLELLKVTPREAVPFPWAIRSKYAKLVGKEQIPSEFQDSTGDILSHGMSQVKFLGEIP